MCTRSAVLSSFFHQKIKTVNLFFYENIFFSFVAPWAARCSLHSALPKGNMILKEFHSEKWSRTVIYDVFMFYATLRLDKGNNNYDLSLEKNK